MIDAMKADDQNLLQRVVFRIKIFWNFMYIMLVFLLMIVL